MPNGENRSFKITEMTDADGNSIDVAPHPQMIVKFKVDFDVEDYSIVRTKVDVKNLNDR